MYDDNPEPEALSLSATESITRGEVDMQVSTAKRYPRSVKIAQQKALSLATIDEETAASCFYSLNRQGKSIQGPGVRLAEIIATSWGNLRCEARVVEETDRFIVAQGTCWDMETNFLARVEVRRRITNSSGKKYSDDMVGVTANAACSIAFRNAIYKVVPKALVDNIYEQAKKVAIGDASTLGQRRHKVVDRLVQMGATLERILHSINRESIDEIDLRDVEKLIGYGTAIKDGDSSVDQLFPPVMKVSEPNFVQQSQPAPQTPTNEPATATPPADASSSAPTTDQPADTASESPAEPQGSPSNTVTPEEAAERAAGGGELFGGKSGKKQSATKE